MKLAFCLYKYFPYGGLERDFLRIATICKQRGHTIHVYTIVWEGAKPEGFEITVIPVRHWSNHVRNRRYVAQLAPLLAAGNYDAVVGFNKMPGIDIYYAADPCYRAKVAQSRPWYYRLSPRYRHFAEYERAVFGKAAAVELMMISEVEQGHFRRYYDTPPERFHVLPPGISRDRMAPANAAEIRAAWRHEFGIGEEERVLLMVGSAFKRKGLDRALLGMAALPEPLREKTRLIMIGEDDPRPFQRLADKLGIGKQLEFFLGRDDVPRFLLGADLFLHPAYSENTGTVILEAMVAGLPVLVTAVCGYAFHVDRSDAGQVVPEPYQQETFNHQLEAMLTNLATEDWSQKGIEYGRSQNLYSMPEAAADLIEAVARKKRQADSQ